jgi:hydroxylaminobenzene mutase
VTDLRQSLAKAGAWLFFIGLLTGLWSAVALTGQVQVEIPRLALAAHLNALLGGLWCIAVAWTFDFLHYEKKGLRRLAILTAGPAWANWLLTVVASVLGVRGLEYGGSMENNIVAALLQAFVVLPALIGAGAWAFGFRKRR